MAIIELSDYERWKADQQQKNAAGANVVLGSIDTNPDEVAGDMTLGQDFAKVTGKPVPPLPMVTEYRPVFQQAIERSKNATILSSSPMLADWLKKPENAALAKDDLEGLSWFETTMGAGKNALSRGVARIPQATNQMLAFGASERLADEGRSFGEILSDRTTIRGRDGEALGNKTIPGPDDLYFAGARYLQSRILPMLGMDAEEAAVGYQQAAGEIAQRIAETPMSPAGSRYRDVFAGLEPTDSLSGDFSQFVSTVADDPAGFLAFLSEVAAESIPMLGATAAVAAATRNPTVAATFMGTMSGSIEAGVSPMELLQERGVDVSTPEGALAAVMDVDLMREAQRRGVLRGVVIGALDGISGGVAGQQLAKSPIGNAVLQSVAQAFLGGLGEASAQVTAGQEFNLNDVIIEALAEFVTAPIEVASVGAGQFVRGQRAARDAETRQALFQELSGQAVNSKLRARMPDAFRQFLERATENGPVENVFVPADKFTEYFQGIGVDPYALVDELDGVNADALRDALATGGDLQIPTATYAASIAGSEHDAFLMENMRFDPDEFTSAEARAFNERAGDALNEAYAEAERMRAEDERFKSFEAEIYDTMVERLRIAGRSTDVATNEAMLYPAFYRVMAERSGLTIEEFMQRYPLPQVRGELPQGVQSREVDDLTRTLAEARSFRSTGQTTQRTPLLEFISNYGGIEDRGGELRARDAVEIRRGRGRSTLRLARDTSGDGQATMFGATQAGRAYGPDDVAQAAIEAGLMADNPVVQEYQAAMREGREIPDVTRALWDEIDKEMRGQASMTADDMNADVSDDDRMQALEEYLSQIGVSLDDDDAVIREAVARDQSERGAMYGQDGRIATDSEAFKRWFGDSKVVGPDGEPLVVYHGTASDFEAFSKQAGAKHIDLPGFFFTPDAAVAERFSESASRRPFRDDAGYIEGFDGANVVPVYLSIQNPAEINLNDADTGRMTRSSDVERMLREAQDAGHDGAIIRGWSDGSGDTQYVAFTPTQIKSVNNRGTFDPNDARILYQGDTGAAPESPAFLFSRDDGSVSRNALADEWLDQPVALQSLMDSSGVGPEQLSNIVESVSVLYEPQRLLSIPSLSAVLPGMRRAILDDLKVLDAVVQLVPVDVVNNLFGSEGAAKVALNNEAMLENSPAFDAELPVSSRGEAADAVRLLVVEAARVAAERALVAANSLGPSGEGASAVVAGEGNNFGQEGIRNPRALISFPAAGVGNGDTVITLFRSANLSSLLHESGHYFLTVMQDMAQRGEPAAAEEFQSVKDWWRSNAGAVASDAMRVMPDVTVTEADVITALDNGTTGDVLKDAAIDVGMQEQFARGFEAYLMEGKAPSQALRGAFEKFRAWLLSVYKSLRGLNVEISPEIRRVFDRMLATDDEIANAAEASGNLGSIFASAEDMGLTADDYAAFLRLAQQADDEASQKLLAETMAPIQRETEKWFKDERTKVRAEVERNVNAQRHYRAWEWMGNRRWLGDEAPQGLADMRMSKDMLVARYGAGVLKTLPRGKQTLYAVEGGVDPDVAADVFGFSSGDEMIKALERAVPRKEAIEAETDRVMFERHGDPLADGTVQQMALDAVHGDKRARTLAVELKALTDVAGSDRGITHKEAREIARQTLSRTKVRDAIAANRYLTAERKAGEEAQRLAATVTRTGMWMDAARRKVGVQARAGVREGDTAAPARVAGQVDRANTSTGRYNENVQKLIEAKRRQLLNHAMYAEARRISAEVESAERLVTRLQKKSTREKLAGDYLEAIDELLQRYDFRKISGRAEDRRGALLAYVERMTAEGRENELAIPDRVLQDAQRTPYKKITVEHLRGVVDSLKNIEHTARLKRTLQDAQSQRELDAVVEDIVGAFDKNLPKRPPARVGDNAEGRRKSVRGFLDLVLNATTLLREIDGFEDMGAAYRNLKSPIDAAMNRLQGRRQKAAGDLDALYEVYTKQERRAMAVREFIPEIDASLSKWERIAVALNMGNEGNYQRLTDTKVRGGFTEAQVEAIVATLDERDAAFIQTVWDYLETFRPDIEAREKRVTGVAPKWVEARPVEIAGRTLKGGYYPLRYDPRLSSLARDDATQDIAKSLQAGRFGKAQTRNGHLKERAQSSGRAVELDIAVLHKHVQQVVYDIELSEPVNNSWRVLQDSRIRDAFMNAGKQADFDALEIWLKDVAEGELMAADVAGRMARRLKSNFTAAKLAFNLSTVAVQITGVAQSMVVVGKKDFLGGVVASMRPGVMDEIASKSQFMNDRQTTFNKDIFDLYNDPKLGPVASRWTEVRNDWIAPMGLWLMTKVQFYLVDMPTWLAGYQQGLRKFGTEDQAVAYADDVVKRAQASGLFSDRSAIERGSANMRTRQNEFLRLFTTLGSYMFAKFNVAYERTGRAQRVISSEGATMASVREAASWTIDMAFLFALEAVMYAAIKGRLPDEEDDEDGDGLGDEWALFVARESALSIASTIPFVRDISSVIGGFSGGGAYGAITEELARPFQQAGQGEIDAPLVKSIINVTGLATGIPSGQINRAVDAGWRAAEGEDVSPAEYLLGRMGN